MAKTIKYNVYEVAHPDGFTGPTHYMMLLIEGLRLGQLSAVLYNGAFPEAPRRSIWKVFKDVNKAKLRAGHLSAWKQLCKNAKYLEN